MLISVSKQSFPFLFFFPSSLSSCLLSDIISSCGYHRTVIECRLYLFPDNLHRLTCMSYLYDALTASHFGHDVSRAEYERPISLPYLFSSNISCNLAQRSDSFPDSAQGSDLHSSASDAVTPFLNVIHEEGLLLFTLAQRESACLCNSGGINWCFTW